jgi:hypothetical protein
MFGGMGLSILLLIAVDNVLVYHPLITLRSVDWAHDAIADVGRDLTDAFLMS